MPSRFRFVVVMQSSRINLWLTTTVGAPDFIVNADGS
jgi:hypothetical protein